MSTSALCTLANKEISRMEKFLKITFTLQERELYLSTYVELYFAA